MSDIGVSELTMYRLQRDEATLTAKIQKLQGELNDIGIRVCALKAERAKIHSIIRDAGSKPKSHRSPRNGCYWL